MMKKVAIARPNVPPSARPKFHPKYMPEITYPTPNPHSIAGVSVRFNSFGDEDKLRFFIGNDTNILFANLLEFFCNSFYLEYLINVFIDFFS